MNLNTFLKRNFRSNINLASINTIALIMLIRIGAQHIPLPLTKYKAMGVEIEKVIDRVKLGEGPHWDIATQSLYFVDIVGHSIHKYTPDTKKHNIAQLDDDQNVSFIIPEEGSSDTFVVGISRTVRRIRWNGESNNVEYLEILGEVDQDTELVNNRVNDGKCDHYGKLWTGTIIMEAKGNKIKDKMGAMYSLEGKNAMKKHQEGITASNGLAWNSKHDKMYYIDTMKGTIDEYSYNRSTGVSDGKPIFTVAKHSELQGLPDGMTIDADDNLWVALFTGYCVIKIDPRKPDTLLQVVKLPAKEITSVAFGGQNLDELYVTSGCIPWEGVEAVEPEDGCTFRVKGLGVKGLPAINFKSL